MKLPILTSVIILTLTLGHAIRYSKKQKANQEKSFWEKEAQANATRKKSLDGLNYIHIPLDSFPTNLLSEDEEVKECIRILQDLSETKIVNLTGYTNTDLKLEYGAANITVLSEYDQNYTVLARTLQKWADKLLAAGYEEEAKVLMEFAVRTDTDISRTYDLLADAYLSRGERAKVGDLIATAEHLHSSSKSIILRHLKAKLGDAS